MNIDIKKSKGKNMFKKLMLPILGLFALGAVLNAKCKRLPIIGEKAPAFIAESTQGKINFPEQYKGKWIIFFSHPADFTPVCTTEFVAFQSMQSEFKKLNAELVGLSVDNLESHEKWIKNIEQNVNIEGCSDNVIKFPIIEDDKKYVAQKYGMLPIDTNDTRTVRAVFIIDPKGIIRAVLYYPACVGRNIPEIKRILTALKTVDEFGVVTPANWESGKDVLLAPSEIKNNPDEDIHCSNSYLCFKNLSKETIENRINLN